jgi:GT2 family glycosyltransferase
VTGAVIVTYNSGRFLKACLEAAVPKLGHVVVVDNASSDDTVAVARRFPSVDLRINSANMGFATAANQGVRAVESDFVLLLNPDTVIRTDLDPLVTACSLPGVGAAAGKLMDGNGKPQAGFTVRRFPGARSLACESLGINRLWPGNPVNRRYRCSDLDLDTAQYVEQPAGAFLMFRRDVWFRLGGFDERFHPLWFEDVDFLRRMTCLGYSVWYDPAVEALHYGGHSLESVTPGDRQYFWYGNLLKYAAKHFGPLGLKATAASVAVGCAVRSMMAGGSEWRPVARLCGAMLFGAPTERPVIEKERKSKLTKSHSHGL